MRVIIIVPEQNPASGNWVSAQRFRCGLEQLGHQVALLATGLHAAKGFKAKVQDFNPDVALLLHAYRSGKPWLESAGELQIPCVVMLTGTDINFGLDDSAQKEIIVKVIRQAAFTLLQNQLLFNELTAHHPALTANLRKLAPGIALGTAPYDLRTTHGIEQNKVLFLCPAGLRAVKGLIELLQMFDQVAAQNTKAHLAFCGPALEKEYSQEFLAMLATRPWASYLGTIPVAGMPAAMRGADVILNNSEAEGLANSMLEAAALGIPILARRNPGNAAVVDEGRNGLLYASEAEFLEAAKTLLDRRERAQLKNPEPIRYNPKQEAIELADLLREAVEISIWDEGK